MSSDYAHWFARATSHPAPRPWQRALADASSCDDRLIRIPTGLGKTEGVLAAWFWHRVARSDDSWPRRLVWCLPMRVLVEQTAEAAARISKRLIDTGAPHVEVHTLMGGVDSAEWHLHPERPAILVGTQDMLLSRALNRGYAASRARWPIDFALLNHDCLWVLDEVQLMDVGLTTSVQLQAFRADDERRPRSSRRPARTWWMSATLQPAWLETIEWAPRLQTLEQHATRIFPDARVDEVWAIRKACRVEVISGGDDKKWKAFSEHVSAAHSSLSADGPRVTLAIVNRVGSALHVFDELRRQTAKATGAQPDLRLVHSRFRPHERKRWTADFLSRAHCGAESTNRIIVATQVVEAGIDLSAGALVTELAPWPNLVQRVGRVARYGGHGLVTVVDREVSGKDALPYDEAALASARRALATLDDMGLASIEDLEASLGESERGALYPFEPAHVLVRAELDELFDTSPDLGGADIDISRFIRSGDDRDVHVWWADIDPDVHAGEPDPSVQPHPDALCAAPVHEVREWIFKSDHRVSAWVWDFANDAWRRLRVPTDLIPGRIVLVAAAHGGYDPERGFVGAASGVPVPVVAPEPPPSTEMADLSMLSDRLSETGQWKTIATHGREVAHEVRRLCNALGTASDVCETLELAGVLHDWGKAHPVFQHNVLRSEHDPGRQDLAKFPQMRPPHSTAFSNPGPPIGPRKGFRHELASVLGVFEWLVAVAPHHPGALGGIRHLVEAGVLDAELTEATRSADEPMARRLAALDAASFDLLAYVIAAHHGKVRGAWHATLHDQDFPSFSHALTGEGQPIRGVRSGDRLPPIPLELPDGTTVETPEVDCRLDLASLGVSGRYGRPWVERVIALREDHGPFALAFLETILRVADVLASRSTSDDPRLVLREEGDR